MQFLCQGGLTGSTIGFNTKTSILHRDSRQLTAKERSARQMKKNQENHFGAIMHQNGSLSIAHQFGAKFQTKGLETFQHGGIGRRHRIGSSFHP